VAAADILRMGIVDVGKSTICNLLKKNLPLPDKESIIREYAEMLEVNGKRSNKKRAVTRAS